MSDTNTNLVTAQTIANFMAQATVAFEGIDALRTTIEEFGGELRNVQGRPMVLINLDEWHWILTLAGETRLYQVLRRTAPDTLLDDLRSDNGRVSLIATILNTLQ